MPASISNNL